MRAIYKRELDSYFHSMIGYVFIAFFFAFIGVYFMAYNLNYGYPIFSYVLSSLVFILLIAIPVLTMKSFSEDRKSRTDQLLLTAPVSLGQIVMGKYLAMVTAFCHRALHLPDNAVHTEKALELGGTQNHG